MGYEIKLKIGKSCNTTDKMEEINGSFRKTGTKHTYFIEYASIDMCKLDYNGEFHKRMHEWKNTDKTHEWYWYIGEEECSRDCYDERYIPQKVSVILDALKIDAKNDDYRRFKWAIALLESMLNDEEIEVLVYGH